ncbi:MAG: dihydroneopterin aldolase [Caulobacteraceae bacterium]
MTIFVRALKIEAEIGVYDHEHGQAQPLIVDIEVEAETLGAARLDDTINYETLAAHAETVARDGHVKLVEAFAERVARACLEDPRVTRARVRVEKPNALAPRAEAAGVDVVISR